MKVKIPERIAEVCDICNRESGTSVLETCNVCKNKYCFLCEAYLPGCMMPPNVCRKCDDREDVKSIIKKYSKDFLRIFEKRQKALTELPKNHERTI